ALERLGGELDAELDEKGTPWYAGPRPGPARRDRHAFLLPTYDETIVGYQGLRTVPARPLGPGPFERAAVVDGRAVGSWRRTPRRRRVPVELTAFAPVPERDAPALESAAGRLGRFFGLEASLETSYHPAA